MRHGGILVPDGSAFVECPLAARLRRRGIADCLGDVEPPLPDPVLDDAGIAWVEGSVTDPGARVRTPGGLHMELVDRAGVGPLPQFVTPIGDPNRDL